MRSALRSAGSASSWRKSAPPRPRCLIASRNLPFMCPLDVWGVGKSWWGKRSVEFRDLCSHRFQGARERELVVGDA